MLAGKFHEMKVERQTPLGYTLMLDGEEFFLHQAEVTHPIEVGETIEVFVYYDAKKRLTATMQEPAVTTEEFGWVEVVDVRKDLGVFC